jgi:hypothetical protein
VSGDVEGSALQSIEKEGLPVRIHANLRHCSTIETRYEKNGSDFWRTTLAAPAERRANSKAPGNHCPYREDNMDQKIKFVARSRQEEACDANISRKVEEQSK